MSSERDWRPGASLTALRARSALHARMRDFFAGRGVLEVETPILSRAACTDPQLASIQAYYHGPDAPGDHRLYLHTSPEFAMKRLLAAGSGPIWQLCKAFRDGETGLLHNPEFTLLEWYRPGFDLDALMDETEALVRAALDGLRTPGACERLSYREAFLAHADLDPFACDVATLAACAVRHGVNAPQNMRDTHDWLDLLMSHVVQPRLGSRGLCFVHHYPAAQAALARLDTGDPRCALRCELFWKGVELANGFVELSDADEQARRFAADNAVRHTRGLPEMPADECLLAALAHGLPDCAGMALGVDRLLMLGLGVSSLDAVLSFDLTRA